MGEGKRCFLNFSYVLFGSKNFNCVALQVPGGSVREEGKGKGWFLLSDF